MMHIFFKFFYLNYSNESLVLVCIIWQHSGVVYIVIGLLLLDSVATEIERSAKLGSDISVMLLDLWSVLNHKERKGGRVG